MGDSSEMSENMGDTNVIELTGKIMVVAIIILFFVVVFVFCLHLYAKWFWYNRRQEATTTTTARRRRRRFDFAASGQDPAILSASATRGLEPGVLKTLTVVTFDPIAFRDGLECAVCLCEVSEGEKARLLPKCNHGFHLDCIDMWFQSHSTCPLCRNPVAPDQEEQLSNELIAESNVVAESNPSFPTNVLFWGDESRVSSFGPCLDEDSNNQGNDVSEPSSSSSSGHRPDGTTSLVIDIPREMMNVEEEEQKSPMPTRLRSLKRLLSGNRRTANPSSPRNLDLEQGNNRGQS